VQIICRICEAVYDDEMAQQRRSHKAVHHKAISAQNRLRHAGPCDLPINSIDRRELKLRSMRLPAVDEAIYEMWGLFSQSLAESDYDLNEHPSWTDFATEYILDIYPKRNNGAMDPLNHFSALLQVWSQTKRYMLQTEIGALIAEAFENARASAEMPAWCAPMPESDTVTYAWRSILVQNYRAHNKGTAW